MNVGGGALDSAADFLKNCSTGYDRNRHPSLRSGKSRPAAPENNGGEGGGGGGPAAKQGGSAGIVPRSKISPFLLRGILV